MAFQRGRPKYGNHKVSKDGVTYDSAGEAKRFADLTLLNSLGKIRNLQRQVNFDLFGKGGNKICAIRWDFAYFEGNTSVVEDWKGVKTPEFKIKEKLFLDNYPGYELRLSGPWKKIEDTERAKSRAKYAQKKMLAMMGDKA